jgi:hypothetical protein
LMPAFPAMSKVDSVLFALFQNLTINVTSDVVLISSML